MNIRLSDEIKMLHVTICALEQHPTYNSTSVRYIGRITNLHSLRYRYIVVQTWDDKRRMYDSYPDPTFWIDYITAMYSVAVVGRESNPLSTPTTVAARTSAH